jgi:Fe-S-cluster containining protein
MDSKKTDVSENIFECVQCGTCCAGYGGTYITENDIRRISEYIGVSPGEFTSRFCTVSAGKYILDQREDGRCIFFSDAEQCTIHPVKPYMCKAWPFISAVIRHPENWDAMAGQCPGMKQGIDPDRIAKIAAAEKKKLDSIRQPRQRHCERGGALRSTANQFGGST